MNLPVNFQSNLKKTFIFCLFLIGVSALYSVIKTNSIIKNNTEMSTSQKQSLEKDSQNLQNFNTNSSSENQESYIKNVNESIAAAEENSWAQKLLILRKAIILSTLKGGDKQEEYVSEATGIFRSYIESKGQSAGDIYLRDFSIVAGVKLHTQCCFVAKMFSTTSPEYLAYKKNGYSEDLVKLLMLKNTSEKISDTRKSDVTSVSNLLGVNTALIRNHKNELDPVLYQKIHKDLGESLKAYTTAQPILFKDVGNTVLRPVTHYAVAYDYYNSFGLSKLTNETNAAIDLNYEESIKKITSNEQIASNKPLLNEMLAYHLMSEVTSMQRRYGESFDKTKRTELFKKLVESITSSKETEAIFKAYFLQSLKESNFKETSSYTFFIAALNEKEMAEYLGNIGISKETIK